ncbi:MAG: alpha-ketoacid dehydrogenase subunit beta, partial [Proteobacteria bacterium]
ELQEYIVPIGVGKITRPGDQITVVTYSRMVHICNDIADKLKEEGASVEVIDLRSIYPYDWQMIKTSIEKTGRVLFVNEDTEVTNFGEHLAYRATQELFYQLMARPRVIAGKNLPGIGLAPNLEKNSVPQPFEIEAAIREILAEVP